MIPDKAGVRRYASHSMAVTALGRGGGAQGRDQTSITCPIGRTLLDGVCVSEPVADYVACVHAQGASLGGTKRQQISADVGTLGVKAGGAVEVSDSLEKKSAASDPAMLEIVRRCSATAGATEAPVEVPFQPRRLALGTTRKGTTTYDDVVVARLH